MRAVIDAARGGMPVLGICNGFQVLCEAGLLPGALVRNAGLKFVCRDQWLRAENTTSVWTIQVRAGRRDPHPAEERRGPVRRRRFRARRTGSRRSGAVPVRRQRIRHAPANPNGALRDIAGICSADGRIAGLMPHPEHAIDPLTGPTDDGLGFFLSVVDFRRRSVSFLTAHRFHRGRRHRRTARDATRISSNRTASSVSRTTSTCGSGRSSVAARPKPSWRCTR